MSVGFHYKPSIKGKIEIQLSRILAPICKIHVDKIFRTSRRFKLQVSTNRNQIDVCMLMDEFLSPLLGLNCSRNI